MKYNKEYFKQIKCKTIASGVENETTAIWQILLENRTFYNMVKKEFNSDNDTQKSIDILSEYANSNLI